MHPAFSVIVFTTFSGAGYGLAALLGLGLVDPASLSSKLGYFLALGLISLGLLSSTLHLGNPKNAIRAFSQWRSSWLSREGVAAIVTFVPLGILALASIFFDSHIGWLGLIAAFLCMVTVYFTSMIYASLRTVVMWNTWLTSATYLVFSIASGAVILAMLVAIVDGVSSNITQIALAAILIGWIFKHLWNQRRELGFGASSMETATGMGHLGKVRLLERPHAMENYLTREMGFRVARKHADKLWKTAVTLGLIVPLVLLALSMVSSNGMAAFLLVVSTLSIMAGLMTERWLFFATANHAVSLYYGGDALDIG